MAKWYLINSTRFKGPAGPTLITAGELVDDAITPLAPLQAVGAVFAPQASPNVALMATFCQARMKRGGQDTAELDRIMIAAYMQDTVGSGDVVRPLTIDVPLATIVAQVANTPFNIGAPLPAGARLLGSEMLVLQKPAGPGPLSAATASVGSAAGGSDDTIGATNVFVTASATVPVPTTPQGATGGVGQIGGVIAPPTRGGVQLQMNLQEMGSALSAWTAGHLQVKIYYAVETQAGTAAVP